jgi:transcriptional regulator with XRE-family HTH domain
MTLHIQPEMKEIAASLRAIRKQKGLTLKEVEESSAGKWKAVVIGSYERCDRSLSLNKAIALAGFYEVPLDQLLGLARPISALSSQTGRTIIDMRAVAGLSYSDSFITLLKGFLTHIVGRRRDWNGEVLSLRAGDLSTLSIMFGKNESEVNLWLIDNALLLGGAK